MDHIFAPQGILSALRLPIIGSLGAFSQHIMGYDPSRKAWVMGYRRVMGYPPCPNSGRAKKYGVSEVMGYQKVWVMGNSTVRRMVQVKDIECSHGCSTQPRHGTNISVIVGLK